MSWHKKTPTDNQQVNTHLVYYVEKFPELFELAEKRTTANIATKHYIDTGDDSLVKLPPRRYNPTQVQALRDFVRKHEGVVIFTPKRAPLKDDEGVIWYFCCDYIEVNKKTKKNAHVRYRVIIAG